MNEIVLTIILTLLIHSLVGTIIYIATNENDRRYSQKKRYRRSKMVSVI